MTIGRVAAIWRYPVKSMGGEQIPGCLLGPRGIPGDRGWAIRDESAGEIRGAKKLPQLLLCAARYVEEPTDGRIPVAEITLPDGRRVRSDRTEAADCGREAAFGSVPLGAASELRRRRSYDPCDNEVVADV